MRLGLQQQLLLLLLVHHHYQLVSDGSRSDKVFKDKDVNLVAKHLKEYCGETVSPTHVYNHLRKWRQKCAKVSKLKDLSEALWDSDVNAIMLEGENYLGHIKVAKLRWFTHHS
jgi:methionine salvage enolase-phosphatase E1